MYHSNSGAKTKSTRSRLKEEWRAKNQVENFDLNNAELVDRVEKMETENAELKRMIYQMEISGEIKLLTKVKYWFVTPSYDILAT